MPTQKLFLDNTGLTELLNELGQYLKGKLDTLTFDTTPTVNSTNPITSGGVKAALDVKADKTELPLVVHMDDTILTCDTSIAEIYTAYSTGRVVQMKVADLSTPLSLVSSDSSSAAFAVTDKGTSLIISGTNENGSDVWTIDSFVAQDKLTFDSAPTTGSQNPVTSNGIKNVLNGKQDTLVSGTNIKTVNGITLLGSGNITIDGGVQYVEYADYEEMQADMSQESGTIGCDTNLYKYYIFNGQNEKWDAVAKVTDLEWIKTADEGTETYGRLLSDISNASDLYVVNRAPASVETSNGTITVSYTDLSYIYTFEINSTGQISGGSVPIVTSVKNINGNQLSGSGNIVLDGSNLDYTGEERYNLHASETIDQSLDNLDTAIHDLDSIVGEEILTPTIVEHSYIIRDPAASRGNLATSNPWRVEVFKGLSEGENLLVTYSGTDTNSSAQVAGWYSDGDNLINTNYSYISNLNGYAQNIVGKTYLITIPNSTVKALALSLYTTVQAEVKRIGSIQAEIHEIENPNEIESISTTESSVSGGNNTVTITETNGTTTTFNVKNGVDGVSLGEVGLVQTTGNATDKVMSQNAVTEYGRKVTTEDLAGTSDWSKSVLEDNGWVMGAYLVGDTTTANANLCSTHFIPINDISGHNVVFYFGHSNSGARIQFYLEDKTYKDFYGTSPANKRTQLIAASLSSCRWIRMACGIDVISQCYIYDNSTDEYIWKGDEYIDRLIRDKNPVLDYGYFEDNIVKQTEGNSETSVMSQKAVTEYGRKVTAADLAGTSDWIKAKLVEEGWEFGKGLTSTGGVGNNASCCITGFIPVEDVNTHNLTFNTQSGNMYQCWFNESKTFIRSDRVNNSATWTLINTVYDNAKYIRLTLSLSKINIAYLKDNTTGVYIFNGDDYLNSYNSSINDSNVSYDFFVNNLVVQKNGDNPLKVMSQKAITDAINYNVNIEHGTGFTLNSNSTYIYIKLQPKAVSLLNASDKMSFMFSTRSTGNSQDYRYFRFGNGSLTSNSVDGTNGAYLGWSYSRNLSANGVSYTLNQPNSSTKPTPDVWIVTWDRINGIVKFYNRTTLVNTLTADNYKKSQFVNSDGKLAILGGDNNTRIYDIRLFDYDISYLFGDSDIKNEIDYLDGAGILPSQFGGNYTVANNDSSFNSETTTFSGGGYNNATYTWDGDDYHIAVNSGTASTSVCGGKPYYCGRTNKAQIYKFNIEVVSGTIKLCWRSNQPTENKNYILILDENGDEIADYDNIGVGKYTVIRTASAVGSSFNFYPISGSVEIIMKKTQYYKPISCVFHLSGDTMYNKKFYDDQTKSFITLYTDRTCAEGYTAHTMVKTPQRVILSTTSNMLPHYSGEVAIVSGKAYIGMPDYTWKQINNS